MPPTPWQDVPPERWDDWRWQVAHSITDLDGLRRVLRPTGDEVAGVEACRGGLGMVVPPYYAALMDADDPWCPVRRMVVPRAAEAEVRAGERADPLGEELHTPVPGLVHRYPDRALLLVHNRCAAICRFCTRKRWTGRQAEALSDRQLEDVVDWLAAHPGVRDVLVSGGDPLLLPSRRIAHVLARLRSVPSVEVVRVGTRVPVVLPQRVTAELVDTQEAAGTPWVVTHFNHPKELTQRARAALGRLADAGLPLANQTVLLRRVNSSARVLQELFRTLVALRVHPYYLHQCDVAEGLDAFRTPLSVGLEILAELRGRTSGLALPTFVVDCPGGGGKVPLSPPYLVGHEAGDAVLHNWEGERYTYPEPEPGPSDCPYEAVWYGGEAGAVSRR